MENNQTVREEFIVVAPFGSVGEPVVHPSEWLKKNRFQIEEPYVKCVWALAREVEVKLPEAGINAGFLNQQKILKFLIWYVPINPYHALQEP